MAHNAQKDFFNKVKAKFPTAFKDCSVLDCGSLDINGSLKEVFENCEYIGIDIVEGKNVDKVCKTHEMKGEFDTIVSGEMLEHDEYWQDSLFNMLKMCKKGGLIAISAAGEGRAEHGTRSSDGNEWGTGDYYKNITQKDILSVFSPSKFEDHHVEYNPQAKDIYFYGIKK